MDGNGQQNLAWIGLDDVVKIINFSLENPLVSGSVNVVAPEFISNKNFCKRLARHLKRPCLFGIPKVLIQLLLGKEFSKMILGNQKIIPQKLIDYQYEFISKDFNAYLSNKKF